MSRFSAVLAALLAALLLVGPAGAQLLDGPLPDVEIPTEIPTDPNELLDTITGILNDVGAVVDPEAEGTDAAGDLVDQLTNAVEDALADTPLANILALQGEDAIDAAIAFSQATFDSSDTALLARDDLFADALTTGALQGVFDAPLLLTSSDDLDTRTARELVRLGVSELIILGADDAIDSRVVQKLEIAGLTVTRVGGPTRIETATMAAGTTAPNAATAVLTRAYQSIGADESQAYADLLAVSPWAAENDWPILLTQSEVLTGSVAEYLAGSGITEVVIIGGDNAVSAAVEQAVQALGITTRRVAGTNRFGTAVAVAAERGFAHAGQAERIILAEGTTTHPDVWADGFASAAHGDINSAPVVLTAQDTLPEETMQFITDGLADNVLDGGPASLCASFVSPIACEAAGLLLLGDLAGAAELLGISIADLPNLDQLIAIVEDATGLDLPDAPDLPTDDDEGGDDPGDDTGEDGDLVGAALEDPLGTAEEVADDAADAAGDAVDDATGAADDVVDDTVDDTTGTIEDTLDDASGTVDDASGALPDLGGL